MITLSDDWPAEYAYARQERTPPAGAFDALRAGELTAAEVALKQMADLAAVLAANRLRAWVNHEHDERPTRGDLRDDVETLLDERLRLAARIETLRAANERQARMLAGGREGAHAERVKIQAEFTELREELDETREVLRERERRDASLVEELSKAKAERDALTEALDAQSRDTARYRALLRKAHTERDAWQTEAKRAHGKLDHLRGELKVALDEVERLLGALQRAKTSAASRPDHVRLITTTTCMEFPRRVASSDNDV